MSQKPTAPRETAKGRAFRLGEAEYGSRSVAENHGRELFFEAIERIEPECIASLFREPLAAWCDFLQHAPDCDVREWYRVELLASGLTSDPPVQRRAMRLQSAVRGWAERWKLTAPWCLTWAFRFLKFGKGLTDQGEEGDAFPTAKPFSFTFREWEPTLCQRVTYGDEVRSAFEKQLEDYLSGVAADAEKAGLVKLPSKRQLLHFEWLVRKIVQGWSWEQIRTEYDREEYRERAKPLDLKTVRDGVEWAAELVGLERPRKRPGRPRGAKDSKPARRRVTSQRVKK